MLRKSIIANNNTNFVDNHGTLQRKTTNDKIFKCEGFISKPDWLKHEFVPLLTGSQVCNGYALKYSPLEYPFVDSLIQLLTSLVSSNIPRPVSSPSV